MNWLLIVLIFKPVPDDGLVPRAIVHRAFADEEACNTAGRNFRQELDVPKGAKSFSLCVTKDWFLQSRWQVEPAE